MKQKLTDTAIKGLKPLANVYRKADGGGLCIEVQPNGAKLWRYRYRVNGKASMMSLGSYPAVSLSQARALRAEAEAQVQEGRSPVRERQLETLRRSGESARTFEAVAAEWMREDGAGWSDNYRRQVTARLRADAFPKLGKLPLREITAADVLACIDAVKARSPVQAKLVKTWVGGVFRYGCARLLCEFDPTWPLRRTVRTPQVRSHPPVPAGTLGAFLRALDTIPATATVRAALRLLLLTAVRPNELCAARWDEFDLEAGCWYMPAGRMKMREPHTVMLSRQAVELLRAHKATAGDFQPVFPSRSDLTICMSYEGLREAFGRAAQATGIKVTPHGTRSTFSTWANEEPPKADAKVIELCLAHEERNKVKRAYDRAERLPARAALMQAWADHLDWAKAGADVIPISRAA
jgi:integrase